MQTSLTLFHYWRSSCSWRVRWALAIKGLDYTSVPIDLLKNEQKAPDFLKINPNAQVPALQVDGRILTESLAIIEWLDEVYPNPAILPKDPWMKAKARQLTMIVAAGIQPLGNLKVQYHFSSDPKMREAWHRHFLETGLQVLEPSLAVYHGPFCLGEQLSLADLFLVPQIYNALRFQVDMRAFPRTQAIYAHCLRDPLCDKAAPHNQPGAIV